MNILHITDFHLGGNENYLDLLREKSAGLVAKEMSSVILTRCENNIDFLFLTGDFINCGDIAYYTIVEEFIKELTKELVIDSQSVFMCIGNHDFTSSEEAIDDCHSAYYNLVESTDSNSHGKDSFFELFARGSDLVVILNSSYNSKDYSKPVVIPTKDLDDLVSSIQSSVDGTSVKRIHILSHYPIILPDSDPEIITQEQNWVESHLWISMSRVRNKIRLVAGDAQICYFCGDAHRASSFLLNNELLVMTAAFKFKFDKNLLDEELTIYDGKAGQSESEPLDPNQLSTIALIEFSDDSAQVKSINFVRTGQHGDGFNFTVLDGNRRFNFSKIIESRENLGDIIVSPPLEPESVLLVPERSSAKIVTIDEKLQNNLMSLISTKQLYNYGKYDIKGGYTSLAWINVDKIMQSVAFNLECSESFQGVVETLMADCNDSVLVGLDYWGSCIGAELSIVFNTQILCVASRSDGRYNVDDELISSYGATFFDSCLQVIIFADVISSGSTIKTVVDQIKDYVVEDTKFFVISLLVDQSRLEKTNLVNVEAVYCVSSSIVMPVVKTELLPNDLSGNSGSIGD